MKVRKNIGRFMELQNLCYAYFTVKRQDKREDLCRTKNRNIKYVDTGGTENGR